VEKNKFLLRVFSTTWLADDGVLCKDKTSKGCEFYCFLSAPVNPSVKSFSTIGQVMM